MLENKMDTLEKVKGSSSTFQENISCSRTEQQYLENDFWSAAESQSLKEETADDLPEMAEESAECGIKNRGSIQMFKLSRDKYIAH